MCFPAVVAPRVAHIITGLDTGGAERMLVRLLESATLAAEASVVSLRTEGTLGGSLRALGVPVTVLDLQRPFSWPAAWPRFRRALRAAQPDVLQGWMYHGNMAAELAKAGIMRRAVSVWNVRHALDDLQSERPMTRHLIRLGARLSSKPARIVYNSVRSASQHEAVGYDSTKAVVIPNGFDLQRFRPCRHSSAQWRQRLRVAEDQPVVGIVGRYHALKDHGTFVAAAAKIAEYMPAVRFVLAGRGVDGTNARLLRQIGAAGLGHHCDLIGEIADVPGLLSMLDVLCLSSTSEAFPNVLGEAMACGVPCVSTAVGDAARIIGSDGFIVPPRNPEAMAAACLSILALKKQERIQLGESARRRIHRDYSLEAVSRRYVELYAEVSAGANTTW